MRIGILGPSKSVRNKAIISKLAKIVADSKYEIVVCADKDSSTEFFAKEYIKNKGKKIYSIVPLDDKEFGYSWVNTKLGEVINCGTWRNQTEKINEESDSFLCIGYSEGTIIEILQSKWFNKSKSKKPIYIIKQLVSGKLPKEVDELDLRYLSVNELEKALKKHG